MPIFLAGGIVLNDDGSASVPGTPPAAIWSIPVFQPPRNPDVEPDDTEEPQVFVLRFGDGHSQRGPKGLNHIDGTLRLTWSLLPQAEENAIRAFLRERGGFKPFWYGLPGDVLWKWRCTRWGGGERFAGVKRLRAEFERVYDLGS